MLPALESSTIPTMKSYPVSPMAMIGTSGAPCRRRLDATDQHEGALEGGVPPLAGPPACRGDRRVTVVARHQRQVPQRQGRAGTQTLVGEVAEQLRDRQSYLVDLAHVSTPYPGGSDSGGREP